MNRITRCPSCATVYQVEPHQIEVAKGWLRCGQCQHVFDSTGLVLLWPANGPSPSEAEAPSALQSMVQAATADALISQVPVLPTPEPASQAGADLLAFADALSSFRPGLDPLPFDAREARLPAAHKTDDSQGSTAPANKGKFRHVGRAVLVLLALALLAQLMFLQRHAMAAYWPASRPALEALCKTLGCDIQPWQERDAMVIDGASFAQQGEGFVLNLTLRNTGDKFLGMTALELTLQDAADKPVLRRVFLPTDLNAPAQLAPGQSWNGSLAIQVDPAVVFSHYRMLIFYP